VLGVAIGVPLFLWFFQSACCSSRVRSTLACVAPEVEEVTVAAADAVKLRAGWLKGNAAPAPLVIYFRRNAEEVSWLVDLRTNFPLVAVAR